MIIFIPHAATAAAKKFENFMGSIIQYPFNTSPTWSTWLLVEVKVYTYGEKTVNIPPFLKIHGDLFQKHPFFSESMDHAYYRKTPPFFTEMQTSVGSNFEINCRDREPNLT